GEQPADHEVPHAHRANERERTRIVEHDPVQRRPTAWCRECPEADRDERDDDHRRQGPAEHRRPRYQSAGAGSREPVRWTPRLHASHPARAEHSMQPTARHVPAQGGSTMQTTLATAVLLTSAPFTNKGTPPKGYIPLQSDTFGGYALIRSNLASHSDAD